MEWYIPITIIPAVALIISSTSSIIMALNTEITQLELNTLINTNIIKSKLSQLKKLSTSIVFQYIGVLLFLFSGITKSLFTALDTSVKCLLLAGVLSITISIVILLVYSIKAVSIRQNHLKL